MTIATDLESVRAQLANSNRINQGTSALITKQAANPDVTFDSDGAALGIDWETIVTDMEYGI